MAVKPQLRRACNSSSRASCSTERERVRARKYLVDKWVSFLFEWVLSCSFSLRTGLLSFCLPAALSERALAHTPSLLLPHLLSLCLLSLSLGSQCKAVSCRVVDYLRLPLQLPSLSQKHSDRGIVSARGTLENQCSSLPRRVRLCSKPSTDCIPLSLSLWERT